MKIIFEKISFQPTRYELFKLKTFRDIFKRKKKKPHRDKTVLPSITISNDICKLTLGQFRDNGQKISILIFEICMPIGVGGY